LYLHDIYKKSSKSSCVEWLLNKLAIYKKFHGLVHIILQKLIYLSFTDENVYTIRNNLNFQLFLQIIGILKEEPSTIFSDALISAIELLTTLIRIGGLETFFYIEDSNLSNILYDLLDSNFDSYSISLSSIVLINNLHLFNTHTSKLMERNIIELLAKVLNHHPSMPLIQTSVLQAFISLTNSLHISDENLKVKNIIKIFINQLINYCTNNINN